MVGSRSWDISNYRYGYQGSEMDNEVKGEGNHYTTEFRQLDPRLGRWFSVDPLAAEFPWQSPYMSMDGNPVSLTDWAGLSASNNGGGVKPSYGEGSDYFVQSGDNLTKIADQFGITSDQLYTWNSEGEGGILTDPNQSLIKPNDYLYIPSPDEVKMYETMLAVQEAYDEFHSKNNLDPSKNYILLDPDNGVFIEETKYTQALLDKANMQNSMEDWSCELIANCHNSDQKIKPEFSPEYLRYSVSSVGVELSAGYSKGGSLEYYTYEENDYFLYGGKSFSGYSIEDGGGLSVGVDGSWTEGAGQFYEMSNSTRPSEVWLTADNFSVGFSTPFFMIGASYTQTYGEGASGNYASHQTTISAGPGIGLPGPVYSEGPQFVRSFESMPTTSDSSNTYYNLIMRGKGFDRNILKFREKNPTRADSLMLFGGN